MFHNTKKRVAFLIMPGAFVGLENMLPFMIRLQSEGWRIHVVVIESYMEKFLHDVPSYGKLLEKNAQIHRMGFSVKDAKVKKFLSLLRFTCVLLMIMFSRSPRIFTFQSAKGIFYRLLAILSKWKGCYYVVSKANAPLPFSRYNAEEVAMKDPEAKAFLRKNKTTRKSIFLGTHLMHSEFESRAADLFGMPKKRKLIGYPKMMQAWRKCVGESFSDWDSEDLKNAEKIITVLLLDPGIYLYDPNDSTPEFLREVLEVIAEVYPGMTVALRPKPVPQHERPKAYEWIEKIIREYPMQKIIVTNVPNPFLTQKTAIAVAIGETSGLFEYVVHAIPAVEHARFSEQWQRIYPPCSYWQELGLVKRTSTKPELHDVFTRIRNGKAEIPPFTEVADRFGHGEHQETFEAL